jgi:pilus assembly protein Flp/PilA
MLDRFLNNEDGATAIEYGLIAALICTAILGALTSTSGSVVTMWIDNEAQISEALTSTR